MTPTPIDTARRQADADLLIKGGTCAAIGLVVLIAPFFMPASELRNILLQAHVIGWFALVLGAAFVVQGLLRQRRTREAEALMAPKPTYTAERKRNRR